MERERENPLQAPLYFSEEAAALDEDADPPFVPDILIEEDSSPATQVPQKLPAA